ncbi:MAG: hypothetical protein AAGK22_08580 [Acidobacteriota bacterium]
MAKRTKLRDVDGDGLNELLFDHRPADVALGGRLYCIDDDGRTVLWEFEHSPAGPDVWPHDDRIDRTFRGSSTDWIQVWIERDSENWLLVISSHENLYPERVSLLRAHDGSIVSDYKHPGRFADYLLVDLDSDGEEELLLAGVNNPLPGLGHAALVALDLPFARRADVSTNYVGPENTLELWYLLFPRARVFETQAEQTVADAIRAYPDRLWLRLAQTAQDAYYLHIDRHALEPIEVWSSDSYVTQHERLRKAGRFARPLTDDEIQWMGHYLVLPTAPDGNDPALTEQLAFRPLKSH